MMLLFFAAVIYGLYCLLLLTSTVMMLVRNKNQITNPLLNGAYRVSEFIFMIIAPIIGFFRFDEYGPEIPFSKSHVLIIIILTITSSASFWLARLTRNSVNPLIRIALSAGMLQGMILCFVTLIHFIPFLPLGLIYPMFGFELMAPLIALFFLFREFWFYNQIALDLTELLPYRAELGFIPLPYQVWQMPLARRITVYLLLALLFVALQVLFCYGCGQEIDSLIKAFTQSTGFTFSTTINLD